MPGVTLLFAEVRVTATSETVLLLREAYGARYLAAWITAVVSDSICPDSGSTPVAPAASSHMRHASEVDSACSSVWRARSLGDLIRPWRTSDGAQTGT